MLNTFDTYENVFDKYTASYGVTCVTLIEITFQKLVIVTNITYNHFV